MCGLAAVAVGCNALLDNSDRAFDADASTTTTSVGDAASLASGSIDASSGGSEDASGSGSIDASSEGGDDASCASGACSSTEPPSCAPGGPGMNDCGAGSGSCCVSLAVIGGTYDRSYDGTTFTDDTNPATVSGFRLDQYEVTVGRFRRFVEEVVGGWQPAAGAGKHTYLNAGQGLKDTGGSYEAGWDPSWTSNLPTTASGWGSALASGVLNGAGATWTGAPGSNEKLPISSVNWFQSYAFCIWDGGFLPSEAEWNYAATGGSDQRVYPWSVAFPPGSSALSCADAWCGACASSDLPNAVGSESPTGDGKWGQSDMTGNLFEWVLDVANNPYANPCVDCVTLTASSTGSNGIRGGAVNTEPASLLASERGGENPTANLGYIGFRCARAP